MGPKGQTLPSAFGPLLALRAWCGIVAILLKTLHGGLELKWLGRCAPFAAGCPTSQPQVADLYCCRLSCGFGCCSALADEIGYAASIFHRVLPILLEMIRARPRQLEAGTTEEAGGPLTSTA